MKHITRSVLVKSLMAAAISAVALQSQAEEGVQVSLNPELASVTATSIMTPIAQPALDLALSSDVSLNASLQTGANGDLSLVTGLLNGESVGAITNVQGTVDTLVDNTALQLLGGNDGLVNGLINPTAGALAPVTGLVQDLTATGGALAPVGAVVDGLVGEQGALTPVVATVNGLLVTLTSENGLLAPVTGLTGGEGGLLGGLTGGEGGLLAPVTNLVSGVTGGEGGLLGGTEGGLLAPVTNLVGGVTGGEGGLLGGTEGGLLAPVTNLVGGLTGGNAGLLGGTANETGTITDVQGTVTNLLGDSALAPVGVVVNDLIDPSTGALAPVTGLVENLTSNDGALAPVGGLVNGLVGEQGALTPVVGTVGDLLGGLTGGLLGGNTVTAGGSVDVAGTEVSANTSTESNGGLLGGLLGGLSGNR